MENGKPEGISNVLNNSPIKVIENNDQTNEEMIAKEMFSRFSLDAIATSAFGIDLNTFDYLRLRKNNSIGKKLWLLIYMITIINFLAE